MPVDTVVAACAKAVGASGMPPASSNALSSLSCTPSAPSGTRRRTSAVCCMRTHSPKVGPTAAGTPPLAESWRGAVRPWPAYAVAPDVRSGALVIAGATSSVKSVSSTGKLADSALSVR
ncbi:hypothetical protein AB1Y20_013810 [Prymnesium parvum]|uniref:Uncharacterized protein n=1 Tax=Prymnesium parvum TaxID=97485 RepID=A0AB34IGV1_PRYPA